MAPRKICETISSQLKFNVGYSVLLFFTAGVFLCSAVTGQRGFLSIDCGSTKNYTDDATGISWVADANYVSTGSSLDGIYVAVSSAELEGGYFNAEKQFASLRYFDDPRERHNRDCYVLPTTPQQQYLIRLTFFIGNWTNLYGITNDDFSFAIYLNSTFITSITDFSFRLTYKEVIFHSNGGVINVCLVRNGGSSFISSLELRELDRGMYSAISEPLNDDVNTFFVMGGRYDLGGPNFQFKRYPGDAYDRWWTTLSGSYISEMEMFPLYSDINGTKALAATSALAPDLPPVSVMDTAIVSYSSNMLSLPLSLSGYKSYVTAFFQEVDGTASATNVRGINIVSDGRVLDSLNISREAKELRMPIGATNVTQVFIDLVQAPWSRLPPLVNAVEVYWVKSINASQTALNDFVAVSALAARIFGQYTYEGDPCLPVPYYWLQCTEDATNPKVFRVTGLLLDDLNISGIFPEEIFEFKNLSVLSLSQNNLTGQIQDLSGLSFLQKLSLAHNSLQGTIKNLSGLPYLQALDLENNSLSGNIPKFLSSYSYLSELHLDNNNFTGTVPQDLHDKIGLNFTFANNTKLRDSSPSSKSNTGAVVGGLLGGTAGFIGIILIIWCFLTRKRRATSKILKDIRNAGSPRSVEKKKDFDPSSPRDGQVGNSRFGALPVFSLQQVSNATQKFSRKLGEGSFGPVYYGRLPSTGQEVAAKVKSGFSRQGLTEFRNELELLSRIHHSNLVSLVGYCEEADQQVLIYAYLPNGSLRDHLAGRRQEQQLSWKTRLRIAVDSATGLEYLHFHCYPRIIHRDVKSANILLDKQMVAKVADFGISKPTAEGMTSGVDTRIMGTLGYIDPEYFTSQRLTQKSDVFSFGVVLLEILSGHPPHMPQLEDGSVLSLVEWVKTMVREENHNGVFDSSMTDKFDYQSARMVLDLALECVNPEIFMRPDMRQVLYRLVQAAQLEEARNPTAATSSEENSRPTAFAMDFADSPTHLLQVSREHGYQTDVSNDPTFIDPR